MPARKQPKNGRPWTPERVRERLRVSMIANRIEKQALGELKPEWREAMNARGKMVKKRVDTAMTPMQFAAAKLILDKCMPNAQAPVDLTVSGNITVVRRDPTQRPVGYHRKGKASV